jgi:hypothetical protein
MTLTNHLLTGAALSKFLPWPIAVPAALVSHFALDALPHFGFRASDEYEHRVRLWKAVLAIDIVVALLASAWLIRAGHMSWFLIGLVAYLPDLMWVGWFHSITFRKMTGKDRLRQHSWLTRLHANIQKHERPWGAFIELAYCAIVLAILR